MIDEHAVVQEGEIMVARFAPALSSFAAVPSGVLVAAAAGMRQAMVSIMDIVQRAVSRLAFIHHGRFPISKLVMQLFALTNVR